MVNNHNFVFFLGGNDAEMCRIREILSENHVDFFDKNLGWGAHASEYTEEIRKQTESGKKIVLVELDNSFREKTNWTPVKEPVLIPDAIQIDHHNNRSDEPASIIQVLYLLNIEPTDWDLLIAANDSGFIPAMQEMGATSEEIEKVRLADRSAQGITQKQEKEAEDAIVQAKKIGKLTVVRLAHSKCATVTDRLHKGAGGPGYSQLLILSSDGESNFYGNGKICSDLKEKFEGWAGGSGLGNSEGSGFWGGYPNQDAVEKFLLEVLERSN